MKSLAFPVLTIALSACGAAGDQPPNGAMSADEANALNGAAEMLDNSAYAQADNAANAAAPDASDPKKRQVLPSAE